MAMDCNPISVSKMTRFVWSRKYPGVQVGIRLELAPGLDDDRPRIPPKQHDPRPEKHDRANEFDGSAGARVIHRWKTSTRTCWSHRIAYAAAIMNSVAWKV